MLPLLACDRLIFAALLDVWRNPQLLNDLGEAFPSKDITTQSRALFCYLFIDAECAAPGADYCGVGFRLRNWEERLRYANKGDAAIMTSQMG